MNSPSSFAKMRQLKNKENEVATANIAAPRVRRWCVNDLDNAGHCHAKQLNRKGLRWKGLRIEVQRVRR